MHTTQCKWIITSLPRPCFPPSLPTFLPPSLYPSRTAHSHTYFSSTRILCIRLSVNVFIHHALRHFHPHSPIWPTRTPYSHTYISYTNMQCILLSAKCTSPPSMTLYNPPSVPPSIHPANRTLKHIFHPLICNACYSMKWINTILPLSFHLSIPQTAISYIFFIH